MVPRPKHDEVWYRSIRTSGVGKCCPTCDVRMRRPKYEFDPNSATVEHIVPLSIGGDNKTDGQFPNCIPMCHACNQARNKVVLKFGKSIGVVKFLIEQVYCKGVRLAEKYLNAFKRFVSREKSRKAKKKREPLAVSSSSQPMAYGPMTLNLHLTTFFLDVVWRIASIPCRPKIRGKKTRVAWVPCGVDGYGYVSALSNQRTH